jgi:hypothetical protein
LGSPDQNMSSTVQPIRSPAEPSTAHCQPGPPHGQPNRVHGDGIPGLEQPSPWPAQHITRRERPSSCQLIPWLAKTSTIANPTHGQTSPVKIMAYPAHGKPIRWTEKLMANPKHGKPIRWTTSPWQGQSRPAHPMVSRSQPSPGPAQTMATLVYGKPSHVQGKPCPTQPKAKRAHGHPSQWPATPMATPAVVILAHGEVGH